MLVRDMNSIHVRMPDDLKQAIEKEAKINGRSLNSEIVDRLKKSLDKLAVTTRHGLNEPPGPESQVPALTDGERQLLNIFRGMPPEKQLALLSLFK